MRYGAAFIGRRVGAIGVCYHITTSVCGDSEEQARLALYERFEHVHRLVLYPILPVRVRPAREQEQLGAGLDL